MPAAARIVENASIEITGSSEAVPAGILPGQRNRKGTRMPPS